MKPQIYRRCLVLSLCVSVALVVLPIAAMAVYYVAALQRGFHPDAGLWNFVSAAEEAQPAATIAVRLVAFGACMLPLSVILLAANIIASRIERPSNLNGADANLAPEAGG